MSSGRTAVLPPAFVQRGNRDRGKNLFCFLGGQKIRPFLEVVALGRGQP